MLKALCTFMSLLIILSILCSNDVESRIIHEDVEDLPLSHVGYLRFNNGKIVDEYSNDDDRHETEYSLTKRKSELLSSLYGLPYALVGKRNEK